MGARTRCSMLLIVLAPAALVTGGRSADEPRQM